VNDGVFLLDTILDGLEGHGSGSPSRPEKRNCNQQEQHKCQPQRIVTPRRLLGLGQTVDTIIERGDLLAELFLCPAVSYSDLSQDADPGLREPILKSFVETEDLGAHLVAHSIEPADKSGFHRRLEDPNGGWLHVAEGSGAAEIARVRRVPAGGQIGYDEFRSSPQDIAGPPKWRQRDAARQDCAFAGWVPPVPVNVATVQIYVIGLGEGGVGVLGGGKPHVGSVAYRDLPDHFVARVEVKPRNSTGRGRGAHQRHPHDRRGQRQRGSSQHLGLPSRVPTTIRRRDLGPSSLVRGKGWLEASGDGL
jgi:hypothetical protein